MRPLYEFDGILCHKPGRKPRLMELVDPTCRSHGLGQQGALGVAITAACLKATGRPVEQNDVALLANEIERKDLGLARWAAKSGHSRSTTKA